MTTLPGRLTPITEAIARVLWAGEPVASSAHLAEIVDAVIVKSIAAELRALAPTLCRHCRAKDLGALYEIATTGVYVHRVEYGPHDWDDTVCEASPLYERAREVELAAGLPVGHVA